MKNITRHLLVGLLLITGKLACGQGFTPTGLTFTSPSITSCDSLLSLSFSVQSFDTMSTWADQFVTIDGAGFSPFNVQAAINWGDGTTGSYTGYVSASGSAITFTPPVEHQFTMSGTYGIFVTVTNLDDNLSTADSFLYNKNTCNYDTNGVCFQTYLFCDANANGQFDPSEQPIVNAPMIISTNTNTTVTVFTDSSGLATFCTWDGAYTAGATPDMNWLYNHGYTLLDSMYYLQLYPGYTGYFGVNCGGGGSACADMHVSVMPWIGYYQNYSNTIRLNYGNYGATASSYQLSLTFPAGVTPVTSTISIPGYTISGNTISWNLSGAYPYYSNIDYISFTVPAGTPNGTVHQYTASVTVLSPSDCYAANDSSTLVQVVGTSYDPNDKTVDHETNLDPATSEYLTYTIQFQNTGSAPAQDIYIIDSLSANLDWSTLEVTGMSHTMQVQDLGNGVKKFLFPQIWLPAESANEEQSHGYVTYRIKESGNVAINDWIYNTAYIYFDANEPIVTNTTANVNAALNLDEQNRSDFYVYPNPSSSDVTVQFAGTNADLRILDLAGKVLKTAALKAGDAVSLEGFTTGVYLFEVTIDGNSSVKRVVKR